MGIRRWWRRWRRWKSVVDVGGLESGVEVDTRHKPMVGVEVSRFGPCILNLHPPKTYST